MKKSILILLSFLYLTAASGITVSLHYCGGKFKEISLFHPLKEKKCCCAKKKSKDCCNEKSAFVKIKDTHQNSASQKVSSSFAKLIYAIAISTSFSFPQSSASLVVANYHAPPLIYHSPIYLQDRALLI